MPKPLEARSTSGAQNVVNDDDSLPHHSSSSCSNPGKQNKWVPWEEKYLARAKHKGFKLICLGQKIILKAIEILIVGDKNDLLDNEKIEIRA
jgi:hypothetical protein